MAALQPSAPSAASAGTVSDLSSILVIKHSDFQSLPSIKQQELFRDRHISIYQSPIEAVAFDLQRIWQLGDPWAPTGVYGASSQTCCRLPSLRDSDYSHQTRHQDYPKLIRSTLHDVWQRSQQENAHPLCAPRVDTTSRKSHGPIAAISSVTPSRR